MRAILPFLLLLSSVAMAQSTGGQGVPGANTGSGVSQIIAGTGITISPAGGTGAVTINSSASGGTVTAFSYTANVSPLSTLFTCSVTNPTTTPALTCTAAGSIAQNAFLAGPSSGGAGAYSFRSIIAPDLPAATTSTQGAVIMPSGSSGNTLGTAAVQNIGTSGATVPLLNTANTIGANWTMGAFSLLYSSGGIANSTTTNSFINPTTTGTLIGRNIADANPALTVNQANASSTGNIANFNAAGSTVASVTVNGSYVGTNIKAGEATIAFSATPAFTVTNQIDTITLTGNVTSFTIANGAAGQNICLQFIQDATGSRTVSGAPSNLKGFFTVGPTASTSSQQCFTYSAIRAAWIAQSAGVLNQ